MKRLFVCFIFIVLTTLSFGAMGCKERAISESVVRIHIRANSNSSSDQNIKLLVRDNVVDFISNRIASCGDKDDVLHTLSMSLVDIESIANEILFNNGFNYVASATIDNEYFPSRDYDGMTFPSDYYDALILSLGSGNGDNWWCVAYPPLCFVGELSDSDEIKYRSKLLELINNYF